MAPLKPLEDFNFVQADNEKLDKYKSLVTLAPYIPGDISPLIPIEDIPWLDASLIKHGYTFYATHFTHTIFASIIAFVFGTSLKSVTAITLKGQLGDPQNYFPRFLILFSKTLDFFWFYFDQEKAYKTYENVRKHHNFARRFANRPFTKSIQPKENSNVFEKKWKEEVSIAVAADLHHIDTSTAPNHLLTWKPPVAISQLDMVFTQFFFFCGMWCFPKLFGIKNRDEELKGVIHLWAIHGRMLGIQDKYNICLNPDPELLDLLCRNFYIESLKTMDETVVTVQHTFMNDLWSRLPFMTYKAVLYIGLRELQGCEGKNLWEIMSFWDKVSFRVLQGWMWIARQGFVFRLFVDIPTGLWVVYHLRSYVFGEIKRFLSLLRDFMSFKLRILTNNNPQNTSSELK